MANPSIGLLTLKKILNHVFLPPKLPQEEETDTDCCDIALCHLVYQASLGFRDFLPQPQQKKWSIVCQMLKTLLKTTQVLDKDVLANTVEPRGWEFATLSG